jgi:hypothetical protein
MSEPQIANGSCAKCGYVLRGLDAARQCPECGMPIAESLRGRLLRFADRAWLIRICRGLRMVNIGRNAFWGCLTATILGMIVGVSLIQSPSGQSFEPLFEKAISISVGVLGLVAIGVGVGVWLASSREPRLEENPAGLIRTINQAASPLIMPMLGFFLIFHRELNGIMPQLFEELLILALVALIGLHANFMIGLAIELSTRSELTGEHLVDSLNRQRQSARLVPLLLLLAYWLGFIRWSKAGQWTLPAPESQRLLASVMGLVWLAATRSLAMAKACVREELVRQERPVPQKVASM